MAEKKKKLTRNDAAELYRDLHKAMSQMKKDETQETKAPINNKVAKQIAEAIRASMKKDDAIRGSGGSAGDSSLSNQIPDEASSYNPSARQATPLHGFSNASGSQLAITFVVFFLLAKVSFSALEFSGVFVVPNANASLAGNGMRGRIPFSTSQYSEAEVTVLKQLDAKRAEMEERVIDLNKREQEMNLKEQEFVARLAEIRDLTEKLKLSREKTEAQRNSKLEQLSNVYGSMNPNEAAQLIEQLDVTIALSLLERMPEKRIGQILSLMSADRALTITRMLSSREPAR